MVKYYDKHMFKIYSGLVTAVMKEIKVWRQKRSIIRNQTGVVITW